MAKSILVCGYGSGISNAVAKKFAQQGFSVGLVARNRDKLTAAAKSFEAQGIQVATYPADLGDPKAVEDLVVEARKCLGPITVLHWNAYVGGAGDVTTAPPSELVPPYQVSVVGLAAAVKATLADLQGQKDSAVLVTGGGLSLHDPKVDQMGVAWNAMGLSITKAAQHKLVGLLGEKLGSMGIYVGEVVVMGPVKGTAFDSGNAVLEAGAIADKFWELYQARTTRSVRFG